MKIVTLLENSTVDPALTAKHGVSLYIETDQKKILFDSGPDNTFLKNAEKLGIDLSSVDLMILSHGHLDHGGGLADFLAVNSKAEIIMKETARGAFFSKLFWFIRLNIGIDFNRLDKNRIRFIKENYQVDEQIQVLTNYKKDGFVPSGNLSLYAMNRNGKLVRDSFDHEVSLLVQTEGKSILFTGCSHSGLGNILRSVKETTGLPTIDHVIGGFHLFNPVNGKTEVNEHIDNLLSELEDFSATQFYSGHCTGHRAFQYLKSSLGDRLQEFKTGLTLNL